MYLGKAIRLGRLFNRESGRLLAITLDHAIARGVLPGLEDASSALEAVVTGRPDSVTLQKGLAGRLLAPYAGQRHRATRLIMLTGLGPPRRAPRPEAGDIARL
jgi:DhnA family fructose-bisphosphate aldolase class Ia